MKKSDRTKQKLLDAATREFAEYGLAGARVDRIAEIANCNKQAIYTYFVSKDQLFESVYNQMVRDVVPSVPLDANNLPGYATSLVDHYVKHPEVLRLASWYELEKTKQALVPMENECTAEAKITAIAAAQQAGAITSAFHPEHLLAFIMGMSRTKMLDAPSPPSSQAVRSFRKALHQAVERLVRL